jgi:small subunit ribosomal protein S5
MAEKSQQQATTDAYDSRIVEIKRTTKVKDGGRDFSFAAVSVVGDGKGKIGFASGKAKEVVVAAQKASDKARRNMVSIDLKGGTLQYPLESRYGATTVIMRPASKGTGIIAGGALRAVFEVLGVKNVIAKCIGSTNPTNVIKAAISGLKNMSSPRVVAQKRDKTVKEILGHEND